MFLCSNPTCPCQRPLSPWAQEIVDLCNSERRKATPDEQAVLFAELANLGDAAAESLEVD